MIWPNSHVYCQHIYVKYQITRRFIVVVAKKGKVKKEKKLSTLFAYFYNVFVSENLGLRDSNLAANHWYIKSTDTSGQLICHKKGDQSML